MSFAWSQIAVILLRTASTILHDLGFSGSLPAVTFVQISDLLWSGITLFPSKRKAAVVSEWDRSYAPSPVTPPQWDVVPSITFYRILPIDWLNASIIISFDTDFPPECPLFVGCFHSASPSL